MTAFIGTTATGDVATGTIAYDTIFAVGALLFVMTLRAQHLRDPPGPPLPGGLRVVARRMPTPMAERTRLATAGAHAAVVGNLDKQPRGDVWTRQHLLRHCC